MTRFLPRLVASLLLLAAAGTSRAVIVEDLYQAEVPVADHSAEARSAAAVEALSRVFVKVSGSDSVLELDDVQVVLQQAPGLLQKYHYSRDQNAAGDMSVLMEFDRQVVNRLVTGAGAPLWTANRPAVLMWVVVDRGGGRQFLTPDTTPDDIQLLRRAFSGRGLPLQLPLFDLQDGAALPAAEAWRLDGNALAGASARYGVRDVLAGRVTRLSTGNWLGEWSYLSANGRVDRSVSVADLGGYADAGAKLVAEAMAARYAIAPSEMSHGGVMLRIEGVRQYSDYARIVSYLEQIELVEHANLTAINGDVIRVQLLAQADAGQLAAVIELNRRLVPLAVPARDAQLVYQWRR